MEIIIESPHFTVGAELQEYTMQKVGKLAHFDEKVVKSEVLLKLEKSSTGDNKVCEIRMKTHHTNLFSSSKDNTFEEAIIQCVHALEMQLKKYKLPGRGDGKKMEPENNTEE